MKHFLCIILISALLVCTGCTGKKAEAPLPAAAEASASIPLKNTNKTEKIILETQSISLAVGDTFDIKYTTVPKTSDDEIIFSSDSDSISVTSSGTVTVTKDKDATVTVSAGSASSELFIDTYIRKAESIVCDTEIILGIDENVPAEIKILPENASIKQLDWTIEDASILSIDENGTLSGKEKGSTTVTAATKDGSGITASFEVTVTRGPYKELSEITEAGFTNVDGVYTNTQSEKTGSATLMFTGDLMALSAQQYAVSAEGYNFNSSFDKVKDIFASADFVIGNLETLTSHSSPYTYEVKEANGNPVCNAPATYLDALRYANFDAVATANNHASDAGRQGVIETIRMLDKYRIMHTGTFKNEDDPRFLLFDINGIKTAVLSYTEIINNAWGYTDDEEYSVMMNKWSEEKVKKDISDAKAAGAEFVIVYNHWGVEHTHTVTGEQRQHAQIIADAGADIIIGSHTHCLQEADILETNDGRNVPCVYSMGNFVSSMAQTIHNDTIILAVDIAKEQDGSISIKDIGYIPARVYASYEDAHHVVIPTNEDMNGGITSEALSNAEKRISKVMGDKIKERTSL